MYFPFTRENLKVKKMVASHERKFVFLLKISRFLRVGESQGNRIFHGISMSFVILPRK